MSQENVEIVRRAFDAYNRRDFDALWDLTDADAEWVNPEYAVESGTGRFRQALEKLLEVWPDFLVEPEQFLDAGDDVVVVGTVRGTVASGVELHRHMGYIWTIRGGKAVAFRWFNDPAEALEAVGLRE